MLIIVHQVSTGNLHTVYQKIIALFRNHQIEYRAAVGKQRSRVPHKINRPLFAPLIGMVSTYALHKMLDEFERSAKPDFNHDCTGTFQKIMGMPCAHSLCHAADGHRAIYGIHVHRHWYYKPQEGAETIQLVLDPRPLNPLPVRTQGRPRANASTSTRRNPSEFEQVEQSTSDRVTRSQARREAEQQ